MLEIVSLVFCILFVFPIFIIDEIFKTIQRTKGKEFWIFMSLLVIQLFILVIIPLKFASPTSLFSALYFLCMFIFPISFFVLNKYFGIFHFYNNNSFKDNIDFYIALFLLSCCILCAYFFAVFVPFQSGIIMDKSLLSAFSIGLFCIFICFIALLMQEKFNPVKTSLVVCAIIFWYFLYCFTPNIFKVVHLGNYQLVSLTLDKQAKGFIDKNCSQQIKQNDIDNTIVINDIKVLLNIGEEYRLEKQCNDKKIQFSIPSRFIMGKQEVVKTNE